MNTLTIICGLGIAVACRKQGFIFVWCVLLNGMLAIYVSIMLSPTLVGHLPVLEERYFLAAAMISLAAGLFGVATVLATKFFSQVLDYRLPDWLDQIGAGCCAFVIGFMTINYFLFIVSATPLAGRLDPEHAPGSNRFARACRPPIEAACQVISTLSLQSDRVAQVVDWLIEDREEEHDDDCAEEREATVAKEK